jgi:hypothetical protein
LLVFQEISSLLLVICLDLSQLMSMFLVPYIRIGKYHFCLEYRTCMDAVSICISQSCLSLQHEICEEQTCEGFDW